MSETKHKKPEIRKPVSERGREFPCNISRHLGDLRLIGAYEVLCRIVNMAEAVKNAREWPEDKDWPGWEHFRPVYEGGIGLFADACGISKNAASHVFKQLAKAGAVIFVPDTTIRDGRGRFTRNWLQIVLHDEFAVTHKCPPQRFQLKAGRIGNVKAERRKAKIDRANNFGPRTLKSGATLQTIRTRVGNWNATIKGTVGPTFDIPPEGSSETPKS